MFTWNQLLSVYRPGLDSLVSRIRLTPAAAVEAARQQQQTGPYAGLPVTVVGGVARVEVYGVLYKGAPAWARAYGFTATERIAQGVQQAAADPDVRMILLEVDSPGGSVDGLSELGDAIWQARQAKTVIASVDGMAASAAYYAASQADRIVAERTSLLGSIGVRMMLYDFSELFEKEGIKALAIDTGEYKSAGAMGTEITENQQADFQRIVNDYFADFVRMVGRGRDVGSRTVRDDWGTGQVWLAPEAQTMGLVDGIATGEETLKALMTQIEPAATPQTALAAFDLAIGSLCTTGDGRTTESVHNQKEAHMPKPDESEKQPAAAAAPPAATLAELKASFPASSAEWREQCMEQGLTLAQCKDAWIKQLEAGKAEADKKAAEQAAKVAQLEQAAKAKAGVEPLTTGTKGAAADGGDVQEQIRAAVDEKVRETGKPRHDCHAMVMRERPDLREALVAAANAGRKR